MVKTYANITMAGAEAVDGVDLSAHAADITTKHLPAQAGNAGKVLSTDGSTASWAAPAGGLSKELWVDLGGSYASVSTFTCPGSLADTYKITRSLFTCTDSAGTTRRVGYIKSASHSAGTLTVTVVTDTDLASGDKDFKITPHIGVDDYLHLISVPGEVVADASNPQGLWKLDLKQDAYLLPVDSSVRTAAAGSGAACAWNIYADASALFGSAQDMTTNTEFNEKRPTTKAIGAGANITARLTSSAGATNKASDIQLQLYIVPQKLFEAF